MRRRLSLALLTVIAFFAIVVASRYLSPRTRAPNKGATTRAQDSLARLDSARRASAGEDFDPPCFASRIGLPCNPN
jgi:hypothetical protein